CTVGIQVRVARVAVDERESAHGAVRLNSRGVPGEVVRIALAQLEQVLRRHHAGRVETNLLRVADVEHEVERRQNVRIAAPRGHRDVVAVDAVPGGRAVEGAAARIRLRTVDGEIRIDDAHADVHVEGAGRAAEIHHEVRGRGAFGYIERTQGVLEKGLRRVR